MNSREIFGAEIQYFRLDPQDWEKVIVRLKETDIRCVTTYVQWGTHIVGDPDAKHPAGHFDFDGETNPRLNLHRFLDLVEKHGLDLNFRCGPFCCNEMPYGGQPNWLINGEPEIMVWDYQNRPTKGYWIGKPEGSQPSYLHPKYLELCRAWFAEIDPIIKRHLKSAGGCVTMINLDNEISYIVQDGFLTSDYNPVNVKPGGFYHQFLAEKYERASGLPYEKKFAAIEGVPAPREVPETLDRDVAYYLDWCEFKEWAMCQYIRKLRGMHEANGVSDVTFMTNFNPHRPEGIPTRMPSFEDAVGPGGIVGYDFYRGTFMSYSGYHSMARVLKLMNASVRYTWSAEFMSGTWNKILGSRVSDDHMRFMARCALAHGCKALAWFMFHDRDCWGDSPVSSHGHKRPSHAVLAETIDLVFAKIRNWDKLEPQCDVAIIYSLVAHRHTYLGDPSPCNDNAMHVGKPAIAGIEAGKASKEYEGLFRLVEQNGYQAAVVDTVQSDRHLAKYPVAFFPGGPIVETSTSESLRRYVNGGGQLVVTGPWPTLNERGESIDFLGVNRPTRSTRATESIRLGTGAVTWLPEFAAQEESEAENLASIAFVGDVIRAHCPAPHAWARPADGEVSWVDWKEHVGGFNYRQPRNLGSAVLQRGDGESILFVLNHYPDAVRFEVTLRETPSGSLTNLTTGERIELRDGKAIVDIDRKSGELFRVEGD